MEDGLGGYSTTVYSGTYSTTGENKISVHLTSYTTTYFDSSLEPETGDIDQTYEFTYDEDEDTLTYTYEIDDTVINDVYTKVDD